ncbi:MAG: flavodoxin family protein [Acidimicrobiia bacterium]|nr:flavodoxin family protein [Acidimicrobiia bacterium]
MRTVVVYESLTGNTRTAAELIGAELRSSGVDATVCAIDEVDLTALAAADLVVVGSWVDGFIFVGQRPGRAGRLRKLPVIDGKTAAVFCTYAVDPGKTLTKLSDIVTDRGGKVIGGVAIKRGNLADGARDFVDRVLATVNA